jgi:CRP-like cAMP-binding protein
MISPELLRRYPFFSGLSESQLKDIAMISEEKSFEDEEGVFQERNPADALYLLIDGCVDLYYEFSEESKPHLYKEFFIGEINPGEPFGISALIEPFRLTSSARTSKPSRMIRINAEALRDLCHEDQNLAYTLTYQAAKIALERLNAARTQLAAAWS